MQNFLSVLGKFFNGLSIFLTIVHHLIWIAIGGALIVGVFYLMSNGGPGKLVQQILPSQLTSQSSQGNNSNSGNNNNGQNASQSGSSQVTQQQEQCAINILGQTRVMQLLNGGTPTSQEAARIQGCFPNGAHL
jgi:hypothetical protein